MTKIALITGGSRGLGKSMALHLATQGRDIILTYRSNKKEAESTLATIKSNGRKAIALQLDIAKSDSFTTFANTVKIALKETWNRDDFDYLINNAGSGIFKEYMDTTEADLEQMMNEHIKAPFFLSQKLLPVIKNGGRVLNISTGLTRVAMPGYCAYAVMKSAVETLTLYMAKELGSRGITVNTLAPGAIETDFGGGVVRDNQDLNKQLASATALGRVGLPDDIGGVVVVILDDQAGWVNAQRIEASGGQRL